MDLINDDSGQPVLSSSATNNQRYRACLAYVFLVCTENSW